jgi:hypothetical protein
MRTFLTVVSIAEVADEINKIALKRTARNQSKLVTSPA